MKRNIPLVLENTSSEFVDNKRQIHAIADDEVNSSDEIDSLIAESLKSDGMRIGASVVLKSLIPTARVTVRNWGIIVGYDFKAMPTWQFCPIKVKWLDGRVQALNSEDLLIANPAPSATLLRSNLNVPDNIFISDR